MRDWELLRREPDLFGYVYTVRRINGILTYKTRVRIGPWHEWRAFRKIDRMMRDAA